MSNAELVRRYTEEFKNHNNFDIVDEVCSEMLLAEDQHVI